MCKVCTEAVHCVALCTRITLGLGMCKICTEAVHCVSSPLQAFWRWSPLQTLFKFPFSAEGFKPPWSPLQAPFKPPSSPFKAFRRWSPLDAPFKPPSSPFEAPFTFGKASSPLQAPFKPPWSLPKVKPPLSPLQAPLKPSLKPPSSPPKPPSPSEGFKPPSSPLEAPLKPPSSPLEAPFKPPSSLPFRRWSPLEAFRRWSPLQAFVKGTFKGCFAEGEAPFVTEGCPSWRSPEPSWELCVAPQSNESAHQFTSERSGFLTLAQSAWRLFVVPTPNNNAFAGNSRNGRDLIQVSILLAFIIEGNINICHPTCYRAVRLRAFLVEATSTTNDNLLRA